jgi:hypothetical protein
MNPVISLQGTPVLANIAIRTAADGETAGRNINNVMEVSNCEDKPAHKFQQMFQVMMQ